jgi:hypothetical protein
MPNRILKESIRTSDEIDALSPEEEVLFYRLLVACDDYGRFDGRARVVRAACFPLKEDLTSAHVSAGLDRLAAVGLIWFYDTREGRFLQVSNWQKHQQTRAAHSKYPDPPANMSPPSTCPPVISNAGNGNQLISAAAVNDTRNRYPDAISAINLPANSAQTAPGGAGSAEAKPTPAENPDPGEVSPGLPPGAEHVGTRDDHDAPYQAILEAFNDLCPDLPRASQLTEKRRSAIRRRWRESPDLEAFRSVFRRVQASDFLTGRNGAFRGAFDWILQPGNWVKIREGNYDNRNGGTHGTTGQPASHGQPGNRPVGAFAGIRIIESGPDEGA